MLEASSTEPGTDRNESNQDWHFWYQQPTTIKFRHCLPAPLQKRLQAIRHPGNQARTCAGWWLLQSVLPREFQNLTALQRTTQGKPYLLNGPAFNLSHSGRMIGCVLDSYTEASVGIDIEQHDRLDWYRLRQYLQLDYPAETTFSQKTVYNRWTQREAIVKATGMGISQLKSVRQTAVSQSGQAVIHPTDEPWYYRSLETQPGYSLSVAASRPLSLTLHYIDLL